MDMSLDAEQIEHILSHLARLKHHSADGNVRVLDSLRPAWLGLGAWDIVLEDLESQRYRKHARSVQLRLVRQ